MGELDEDKQPPLFDDDESKSLQSARDSDTEVAVAIMVSNSGETIDKLQSDDIVSHPVPEQSGMRVGDNSPSLQMNAEQARGKGDGEEELPSKVYENLMRYPVGRCCLTRFPYTCAVLTGVIIPLFALILVSMGFGAKLCEYEAPNEISANNYALQQVCIVQRHVASQRRPSRIKILKNQFLLLLDLLCQPICTACNKSNKGHAADVFLSVPGKQHPGGHQRKAVKCCC